MPGVSHDVINSHFLSPAVRPERCLQQRPRLYKSSPSRASCKELKQECMIKEGIIKGEEWCFSADW